ncbi:MAG: acetylxylan esterase [Nitrososphaeria archaeon]
MPIVDLPLNELKVYKPKLTKSSDFPDFWKQNIREAEEQPLNPKTKNVDYFSKKVEVIGLTFDGFTDRSPITGYFIKSRESEDPRPAIVSIHGYSGSKGTVSDFLGWINLGFSVFTIDVRGQFGEAPDHARYDYGNVTGNMTKGIQDKNKYYYRYVIMDCYRAINYIITRKDVDSKRVAVMGVSQGGGLAMILTALQKKVALALSSVPYLCHFDRAIYVAEAGPYLEILNYIKVRPDEEEKVIDTLSYFDAMNFAPEITAPTLISVGLTDTICPPSTIFAAYHHIASKQKELAIYPGLGHEEPNIHVERKMKFATRYFRP